MKNTALIFLFFISVMSYAQVGIGTTSPTAQLDIKGDLKVRTTILNSGGITTTAKDSVLVVEAGVVKRVTSKQIYDSHIKSFVKGTGGTSTVLGGSIGSTGYKKIAFNTEVFDENNDYDTSTYEFTAPKTGIYSVYVQYDLTTLVAASNVGVAIITDRSGTVAVDAQQVFSSLTLLSTEITPSSRQTQTLVKLNSGDKVYFGASSSVTITVVGGSKSFFTIMQVE